MKKFLLFFVMLFALSFMTNAQTLLEEGFENGIPSTWTVIDNDGDGYNWTAGAGPQINCHGGTGCVYSASWLSDAGGALTPDNWLITPQVNLTSNSTLTFYLCGQDANYCTEHYAVLISTTGTQPSNFTVLLDETFDPSRTPTAYVLRTVNLSQYTGQQVYIAFRHYNVTDQFYLNLDDVSIFAQPTTPTIDPASTQLNFNTVVLGSSATLSTAITAYNLTQDITASSTAPFSVSADGTTFGTTATIPAAGGTLYVKYEPATAGSSTGTVSLSSTGAPAVDITVSGEGVDCSNVGIPYSCAFDDEGQLNCWAVEDANNDGSTFIVILDDGYAQYTYSSTENADDWLISPVFTMTGTQYMSIDYASVSASYVEKFQVFALGADTVALSGVINVTSTDFTTLILGLDTLNGSYRIGFHCVSDANQFQLFLTNFAVRDATGGSITANAEMLDFTIIPMGAQLTYPVVITSVNVTDPVVVSTTSPFQVSLDDQNYASTVSYNATGLVSIDTVYVAFESQVEGAFSDSVTISIPSQTLAIFVGGEAVDCSDGISTFPYVEDFNDGVYPPVCWIYEDNEDFSPVQLDTVSHLMGLAFLNTEAELITPEITSTNPMMLSLDYSSYVGSEALTTFQIAYTTEDLDTGWVYLPTIEANSTEMQTLTQIIPADAKAISIKPVEMNDYTYWFWTYTNYLFIDNFQLTHITEPMMMIAPETIAFGAHQLNEPATSQVIVTPALLTSDITVTAPAHFEVSLDNTTFQQTLTMPMTGGVLYVRYTADEVGSHSGNVILTSGSLTQNVVVSGSAEDCSGVRSLPFIEDFEAFISPCWTNSDVDGDGYTWKRSESLEAFEGSGCMYSESFSNDASMALTPENWLISPALAIPEGGAEIGWYAAAQDPNYAAEHYQLLVQDLSVEGSQFDVVYDETLANNTWSFKSVSFLPYAGKNIRFAFVHNNCTDMFILKIDNVHVTAGVSVENYEQATVGVYPNPASNMINIASSEAMSQIQIVNMAGQCVYSANVAGNNAQVNVSNLADGMYFVKIYTANGIETVKKINVIK